MIELKKAKRNGDACYVWTGPNGREWRVYKSYGTTLWHYIRQDHDVSSIGYLTLSDAKAALERAFQ